MDDLQAKLAANILTELFKEATRGVKSFTSYLKQTAESHDIFGVTARRYNKSLVDRFGWIKILGMSKPIPLEQIYVRVNVLTKLSIIQHKTIDELRELFQAGQRRFGFVQETISGSEAVNEIPRFVLLGQPGSGKSTFLKYIALRSITNHFQFCSIPIFISLKSYADNHDDLLSALASEFSGLVNDEEEFVRALLKSGKTILLFDGLDEVPSDKLVNTIRSISRIMDVYPHNRCIVSCRIAAYNHYFETFTDIEMADFGDTEICHFVQNWFAHDSTKGKMCIDTLLKAPGTKELATTPLLLTMLCLAYEETMDFSSNRAELYRDAIDALLRKWDVSRTIRREEIYKNLTLKRKEDLFSFVAATTFQNGHYFWKRKFIEDIIFQFIRHLPDVDEYSASIDAAAVLKAIEEQHGIIITRARDVMSFSHLTFHEYFTSTYLANTGEKSLKRLINNHLDDIRWREIIILVANLLPSADRYMLYIIGKMATIGFVAHFGHELSRFLDIVQQKAEIEHSDQNVDRNSVEEKIFNTSDGRSLRVFSRTKREPYGFRLIRRGEESDLSSVEFKLMQHKAKYTPPTIELLVEVFGLCVEHTIADMDIADDDTQKILSIFVIRRTKLGLHGVSSWFTPNNAALFPLLADLLWELQVHAILSYLGQETDGSVNAEECLGELVTAAEAYSDIDKAMAKACRIWLDTLILYAGLELELKESFRSLRAFVVDGLRDARPTVASDELKHVIAAATSGIAKAVESMRLEVIEWLERDSGAMFSKLASKHLSGRFREIVASVGKTKESYMISDDTFRAAIKEQHNLYLTQNVELKKVFIGELVVDILKTPVYIRKETREAVLHTIASIRGDGSNEPLLA